MKITKIVVTPKTKTLVLTGRMRGNFSSIIRRLERPYTTLSEEKYKEIFEATKEGLNGKPTDFIFYDGRVSTFGEADGGYAIMPFNQAYSDTVMTRVFKYADNNDRDLISELSSINK